MKLNYIYKLIMRYQCSHWYVNNSLGCTCSSVSSHLPPFPDIDCVKSRSEDDMEESRQRQRRTYKYRVSHALHHNHLSRCYHYHQDLLQACSAKVVNEASLVLRCRLNWGCVENCFMTDKTPVSMTVLFCHSNQPTLAIQLITIHNTIDMCRCTLFTIFDCTVTLSLCYMCNG